MNTFVRICVFVITFTIVVAANNALGCILCNVDTLDSCFHSQIMVVLSLGNINSPICLKTIGERTKVSELNFVKPDVYSRLKKLNILRRKNRKECRGGEMSLLGGHVCRNGGHA